MLDSELSNANPVVHKAKKVERVESLLTIDSLLDESIVEPIDALEIYDLLKTIKDPEHPNTLEELRVIEPENIDIRPAPPHISQRAMYLTVYFTPTVPHCSMAALIGLCIRVKLMRTLPLWYNVKIYISKGTHNQEESVNKQLNDKERVAAALENPNLLRLINSCLSFRYKHKPYSTEEE